MKQLVRTAAALAVAAAAIGTAQASVVYTLDNTFTPGMPVPVGTVTLDQISATEVDVTAALDSGFLFVKTGNHDAFTFNVSASGYSVGSINPAAYVDVVPGANPGFGSFTDALVCPSCAKGGAGAFTGTLSFKVTAAGGVSVSDFTANSAGYFFTADVINTQSGITGAVGAVPEPESYALMLAGLAAIGFIARRRQA